MGQEASHAQSSIIYSLCLFLAAHKSFLLRWNKGLPRSHLSPACVRQPEGSSDGETWSHLWPKGHTFLPTAHQGGETEGTHAPVRHSVSKQSKASTSSSHSGYRREKLSPEFPLKWSQSMPLSEEGSTQLLWTEREMLLRGVSI